MGWKGRQETRRDRREGRDRKRDEAGEMGVVEGDRDRRWSGKGATLPFVR